MFLIFHRYAGLFMALFLVVAGVTGTAIAFYDELDEGLNPSLYKVNKSRDEHLSLDHIVAKLNQGFWGEKVIIRYTQFPRHESDSIRFIVRPKESGLLAGSNTLSFDWVFVDPYTGNVLGTRKFGAWRFDRAHIMPLLWELHYSLTLPWPYGEWLFGAVALVWVFDCFFAFYLTLPAARRQRLYKWKKAWKVKWRAGRARLIRDIHIAFSLWLWSVLLMLAISSVMFNLNHEVYQPVLSTFVKYEHARDALPEANDALRSNLISLDHARDKGREYIKQWQNEGDFQVFLEDSLTLDLGKHAYRFKVKSSLDLPNSYAQTAVYLSAFDGAFLSRAYPYIDKGNAISTWLGALHMGRVFGVWYQIFVSLLGVFVTVVTVSGVLIWWRKRARSKIKEQSAQGYLDLFLPKLGKRSISSIKVPGIAALPTELEKEA